MSSAERTIATLHAQGYQATAVGAAMMALAIVAVTLRLCAKSIGTRNNWGADDFLIIFALTIFVVDQSLILYAVDQGSRAVDADSPEWSTFSLFLFMYSLLYWPIIAFTTYSSLFLYRRIFYTRRFTFYTRVIAAIVTTWWFTGTLLDGLSYQSTRAIWDFSVTGRYIFDYNDFWIIDMTLELVFEVAVILLPLFVVLRLNLNAKKKALMVVVFGMAGLVLITGVLRICYAWKSDDMVPGTNWLGIHSSVSIVSACLPTYGTLVRKIPRLIPSITYGDGHMDHASWHSRPKVSAKIDVHETENLERLQSFEEKRMHRPQSLADLQLQRMEAGIRLSLSPARLPAIRCPTIKEEEPILSRDTLRGHKISCSLPMKAYFN